MSVLEYMQAGNLALIKDFKIDENLEETSVEEVSPENSAKLLSYMNMVAFNNRVDLKLN